MRGIIMTLLSLGLLAIVSQPAAGAQYLRANGTWGDITGDVKVKGFEDWIDISSWGIGFKTSAGRVQLSHLDFVMPSSPAAPQLLRHLFEGRTLNEAELVLVRNVGGEIQNYATWEFENVQVTKWDQASSGEHPTERFSLLPEQVEYSYFEFNAAGTLQGTYTVSWDFIRNTTASTTVGTVENVQFYMGTIVPEPAGIAVVLLAGGALLMRRRHETWLPC